jgi:hypothetical protein
MRVQARSTPWRTTNRLIHGITAVVLAHIGEVDARRLYLPLAYRTMHEYCLHELHLSEDAAYKRIQAARTARRFPAIFPPWPRGACISARCACSALT